MFDKLKRLLEPWLANKKNLFQNIIHRAVVSSYWIVNIFFIQMIVSIVQSENLFGAWNIAIYFAVFNIAYFIFIYLTRNWRWVNLDNAVQKYVQRKYNFEVSNLTLDYIHVYSNLLHSLYIFIFENKWRIKIFAPFFYCASDEFGFGRLHYICGALRYLVSKIFGKFPTANYYNYIQF